MKIQLLFVILLITSGTFHSVSAQSQSASVAADSGSADIKPEHYYDFWLGEWDLTWEESDGTVARGYNRIEHVLNGRVIKENFESLSGGMKGYIGKSYSVYHAPSETWKQTWVDNQGGYLDFEGSYEEGKRIFFREGVTPQGEEVVQRMVFYEITDDSFIWDWEVSMDEGKNWELRWRINYKRKMPPPSN